MNNFSQRLKAYIETHAFDSGDTDHKTILDQLYQAYAESHETDPAVISEGFKELEAFLSTLNMSATRTSRNW